MFKVSVKTIEIYVVDINVLLKLGRGKSERPNSWAYRRTLTLENS